MRHHQVQSHRGSGTAQVRCWAFLETVTTGIRTTGLSLRRMSRKPAALLCCACCPRLPQRMMYVAPLNPDPASSVSPPSSGVEVPSPALVLEANSILMLYHGE